MAGGVLNIFRLAGDFVHLVSIFMLWLKMSKTRSCAGISLKSQALYGLVYLTRYLDLFDISRFDFLHIYNFLMKCFFLGSQATILYWIWFRLRATYNARLDTFRVEALLIPCAILAFFFQNAPRDARFFALMGEYFWTFSILLESVAILPQMFQLQRTGEAETITTHYLLSLGLYRGFYLLNWLYRFMFGRNPELVVVLAGILQTGLYSDFFWIYYKRVFHGRAFKLPI